MLRREFIRTAGTGLCIAAGSTQSAVIAAPRVSQGTNPGGSMSPHLPYHQTLVIKIFLSRKTSGAADLTVAQALEVIRKLHNLTRGIPTVAYLVGWQYQGHDSKYPSWFEVNRKIAGLGGKDAREGVLKLMDEARQFNTRVSLHINMDDAYENSPDWGEYRKQDLLVREKNGTLRKGGVWDGEQSYLVCKAREWASGHARRRIDALLEFLPMAETGTVHIDVFQPLDSPYHGITSNEDAEAMQQIIRYWHGRGLDVTKEWFHHEFAGLIPMVWHLNLDEASRLRYPPQVLCGGGSSWNCRTGRQEGPHGMPEDGCLYEEAWGHSMYGEPEIADDPENLGEVPEHFCLMTLPWYFLNRHRALRHVHTADLYSVEFTGEVKTAVRVKDRHLTLTEGDRVLVDGSSVCLPALWRDEEWIAFSRNGDARKWRLPDSWASIGRVALSRITREGTIPRGESRLEDGWLTLDLEPGVALSITPA